MDIGAWLRGLGLGQYEQAFRDNEIDAQVLPRLTAEDLKDLDVTVIGHRRKLLDAIGTLRAGGEAPPAWGAETDTFPAPSLAVAAPVAQAERRQLTVMFVDLVGSTALAGRLDPEEMREVLRAYQDAVAGEVARFEGYLAKFMGDGVLAYVGWPSAHEDEAERSVRAGLAAVQAVGSEVIWAPWNWSLIRRSKATRSGLFVSPVASAIPGLLRYLYHAEIYT